MRLRWRILIAAALLVVVPLGLLAGFTRREMAGRLREQYTRRVQTLMGILEEDLQRRGRQVTDRLAALRGQIDDDNRLRLALAGRQEQRPYLLDAAGRYMPLLGLDFLQLQDETGAILSSGHRRQEYGRLEPGLPRLLAGLPGRTGLVIVPGAQGPRLVLAGADSLRIGGAPARTDGAGGSSTSPAGRLLWLVGGLEINADFLARLTRERELAVAVVHPGGAISSDPRFQELLERFGRERIERPDLALSWAGHLVRAETWPLVWSLDPSGARLEQAELLVSHPTADLVSTLHSLDAWLLAAVLVAIAGSLLLALWLSVRLSRPLDHLARQAAALDLDRLDADFPTRGRDEVGTLGRVLAETTDRLRASVARLREAERLQAAGELARQVNHDLRNGLTPLRNVVRHLSEVATSHPADLAGIYRERQPTLEGGLDYLEQLARGWARLGRRPQLRPCSLPEVVAEAVPPEPPDSPVALRLELDPKTPAVLADPVALRRILENLVANARESLSGGRGEIIVRTYAGRLGEQTDAGDGPAAILEVQDDGRGIAPDDRARIFDDFFTTKTTGGGLGLSIVRRLVSDHEGRLELSSEPGRGSLFRVRLPAPGKERP